MKRTYTIIIAIVALLAVGGGAFWGGTLYEANRLRQNPALLFQGGGDLAGQFRGGAALGGNAPVQGGQRPAGAGGTMGTIASVDGNDVTITTQDGATILVKASDTTLVEKTTSATVADLTVGERVVVSGSTNDDGSITARSIQSQRDLGVSAPAGQ